MPKNQIETLKSEQLILLRKLIAFFDYFKIKYFIGYGTLLGSFRHQGYIPWDDDIDLWLFRESYNKLLNLKSEAVKKGFQILDYNSENFPFPFIKIVDDSKYLVVENSDLKIRNLGINIDIFPLDNFRDNIFSHLIYLNSLSILRKMWHIKSIISSNKRSFFKNLILIILKFFLFPIQIKQISFLIDRISKFYNQKATDLLTIQVWGYGKREIYQKVWFEKTDKVKFEYLYLNAPNGKEYILEKLYGDYKSLPPLNKQFSKHDFKLIKLNNH